MGSKYYYKHKGANAMLRIGLLGCGTMGKTHAHAYAAIFNAQVVAVCDIRKEQRDNLAHMLDCSAYDCFESMLADQELDIVDICLPTYLHKEYAVRAMEKKLHVFCEKPIALSLEDAQAMIDTAKKEHVKLTVGHVLRFFQEYETLKKSIDQGRIGTLRLIRTIRNQAFPPWSWEHWYQDITKSGGPEVDLAIHDYDWILSQLGPVSRVYAKNYGDSKESQMHSLAILRLANGAMAHVEASWAMPKGIEFRTAFELIGTDGQLCYDSSKDSPLKTQLSNDEKVSIFYDNPMPPNLNPYAKELRFFIDAVEHDTPVLVRPEEARAALAVRESSRTGKVVVLQEERV
jgi:predicted dehydrogenase